jgi:hypothetical protein
MLSLLQQLVKISFVVEKICSSLANIIGIDNILSVIAQTKVRKRAV